MEIEHWFWCVCGQIFQANTPHLHHRSEPNDDLPESIATHTLQESRRVCESIACCNRCDNSTHLRFIGNRPDSIVAIANTPEPIAGGEQCPLTLALSPIAARQGREDEIRVVDAVSPVAFATCMGSAGPPGLKIADGTPWFNSRRAWTRNLQRRFRTGGTPVPRRRKPSASGVWDLQPFGEAVDLQNSLREARHLRLPAEIGVWPPGATCQSNSPQRKGSVSSSRERLI